MKRPLLELTDAGLYCEQGDFFIDPWKPRGTAVITHAHADHSRYGAEQYLAHHHSLPFMRHRLGKSAPLSGVEYGETVERNGVTVSLHPAGHILGSAQVRVEYRGEIWVVSGDYKVLPDASCAPFEPVRCHHFITEATFALPIYRWQPDEVIFQEIRAWWEKNRAEGKTSLLYAYALGKAQRILQAFAETAPGPIGVHGAVLPYLSGYRAAGIALPEVLSANAKHAPILRGEGLIIAPPSAASSPWTRKFAPHSQAFASGWMRVRGKRRRRTLDRGFVLSDHADWPGLLEAISATGAEMVSATHGATRALVRYLNETGIPAKPLETPFTGEDGTSDQEEGRS
ncbi:ligase-associated DNA damage response exonuclease [bacterium]|nr:ligase-associated DNA damage response exonuclease [bacterium]